MRFDELLLVVGSPRSGLAIGFYTYAIVCLISDESFGKPGIHVQGTVILQ